MGKIQGQGSESSSSGRTYDSALSRKQLEILKNREQQYNLWFFPELQNAVAATDVNSQQGQAKLALMGNQINTAYDAAQKQTNQALAQQNLLGYGNGGVAAALQAQNNRARASALAQGYYNTVADSTKEKTNLLQIGAGLMPQPTQSAQYHQKNTSGSTGWGFQF